MASEFSNSELEAYLDEALPPADMARVEAAIREQPQLVQSLSLINSRRDAGVHTLGEIWRRQRVSCPPRDQLGGFLLNTLGKDEHDYVSFHVDLVGCRFCVANLADLERQHGEGTDDVRQRRRKYFESSAGYLHDSK